MQACVLKVNFCCDGCQKKVRRVLHKIEGVCTVTINEEEGKVTVTGAVDPAILIKKLNEVGKHAEVIPTKGGNQPNLTDMLQKLKLDCVKGQQKENGKSQKGGGGGGGKSQKSGASHKEQKQTREQGKGFKDLKFPNLKDLKLTFKEDNKKFKFNPPSKDNKMDDGNVEDDFDDEDLDDMYDEFGGDGMLGDRKRMMKPNMKIFNQLNVKGNGVANRKKRGGGVKGANLVQVINKVMGGKIGGCGCGGGVGKQNQTNGSGRRGHGTHGSKKNGGGSSKKNKGGNHGNHADPSSRGGSKRAGGSNAGVGLGLGRAQPNMMMGEIGGFPLGGMPLGYFQPGSMPPDMMMMASGNHPYYHQQYMQALLQLQQQQQQRMMMMMTAVDRPTFPPAQLSHGYGYSRPVYTPQPPQQLHPHVEPYLMFSDENPNSCSVM
ncbi:heavy metal-associated isoprenylated plant protein 32-like isoform X1 [Zingiber officinale]|uniref:heavy metal-associated isoprenylated plant protein 32-like isoform X1 n=2 Tax=Zingiber officinale TaxID=94328 RepID=UPI001C4D269C|nr:heavy metal-associated isoprenylated plant protein 32-like isoform X1 [Zingiber officinale]XP_042457822.1 heavy metal-associated isoprenylated plant protein 32-like isoform X1 [Zingiber officinale]